MDLREQDTAALVASRDVEPAVVLVGMPAGQALAEDGVRGDRRPERAFVQQLREEPESGVEAHLVGDEADEVARLDLGDQFGNAFEVVRDRLFDEQVAAGSRGGQRHGDVKRVRIRDEDGVGRSASAESRSSNVVSA